ncbi:hypothetical protein [Yinghuangia soli]|uniref:Uncharacterized protein n=1 Tax=Yinghuangia soli TaxID=2908204 RepID=A0AA41PZS0_9ACTN|nr:hypothetical protein [Yinghuangia soli]MCF2528671.1 hypothetical protein [Yinghuangia soli]
MIVDDSYGDTFSAARDVAIGATLGSAAMMEMSRPSLEAFEMKVRQVRDMLESSANNTQLGNLLTNTSFGQGFSEAAAVGNALQAVRTNITTLHEMIVQQLEIMALTIKMAGDKTEESDEANRQKLGQLLALAAEKSATAPGAPPMVVDDTRRSID